jgi:hypothetical protein
MLGVMSALGHLEMNRQPAAITWGRHAIRLIFLFLPLAALILLVAVVIRAIYYPPSPQFTADEIVQLKKLVSPSKPATNLAQDSADKTAKQGGFTPDEEQRLKDLAAGSKELLDKKLDAEEVDKFKEDTKRYLEWVIAIAGIFSIVQTIAAAFVAQSFTSQAERDLAELDKTGQTFDTKAKESTNKLDETIKKIPEIARAAEAQLKAFGMLEERLVAYFGEDMILDRKGKFYETTHVGVRQLILSADRYLGYDLQSEGLRMGQDPSQTTKESRKFRGLANFYTSKFEFEKKLLSGQWQDLERARHLLEFWLGGCPSDFQVRNDLGTVLSKCATHCQKVGDSTELKTEFRQKARTEFIESSKWHKEQQRAYLNLGTIAYEITKPKQWPYYTSSECETFKDGLREAQTYARTALKHPNWETRPNGPMRAEILYNMACWRALFCTLSLRDNDGGDPGETVSKHANSVLGPLKEAAKIIEAAKKSTILKSYVDEDFKTTGDFGRFREWLPYTFRTELDDLRGLLSAYADQE